MDTMGLLQDNHQAVVKIYLDQVSLLAVVSMVLAQESHLALVNMDLA